MLHCISTLAVVDGLQSPQKPMYAHCAKLESFACCLQETLVSSLGSRGRPHSGLKPYSQLRSINNIAHKQQQCSLIQWELSQDSL